MSDLEKRAHEVKEEVKTEAKRAVAKVKRTLSGTVGRVLAWVGGSLILLLLRFEMQVRLLDIGAHGGVVNFQSLGQRFFPNFRLMTDKEVTASGDNQHR